MSLGVSAIDFELEDDNFCLWLGQILVDHLFFLLLFLLVLKFFNGNNVF
mgnify:CR=1 FL=1